MQHAALPIYIAQSHLPIIFPLRARLKTWHARSHDVPLLSGDHDPSVSCMRYSKLKLEHLYFRVIRYGCFCHFSLNLVGGVQTEQTLTQYIPCSKVRDLNLKNIFC